MTTATSSPNVAQDIQAIAALLVEALVAVEARSFADDVAAALKLGDVVELAKAVAPGLEGVAAATMFDVATSAQQIQTRLHSGQAQPVAALLPGMQPQMPTTGCLDDEEFAQARNLVADMQRDIATLGSTNG